MSADRVIGFVGYFAGGYITFDDVCLDRELGEREAMNAFQVAARLGKYVRHCERVRLLEFDDDAGEWRIVKEKEVR